jgi:hypothetical protein
MNPHMKRPSESTSIRMRWYMSRDESNLTDHRSEPGCGTHHHAHRRTHVRLLGVLPQKWSTIVMLVTNNIMITI